MVDTQLFVINNIYLISFCWFTNKVFTIGKSAGKVRSIALNGRYDWMIFFNKCYMQHIHIKRSGTPVARSWICILVLLNYLLIDAFGSFNQMNDQSKEKKKMFGERKHQANISTIKLEIYVQVWWKTSILNGGIPPKSQFARLMIITILRFSCITCGNQVCKNSVANRTTYRVKCISSTLGNFSGM